MPTETERKFLVKNSAYKTQGNAIHIKQGFLSNDKQRVVRIRIMGPSAFITIKGINTGISRAEFEYSIPLADAEYLLENLCKRPLIDKHRYIINYEGFRWEVDEFHGENEGLVMAEIELPSAGADFRKPDWLGEEVSNDPRYFNSNLVNEPYRNWKENSK